MFKVKESNYDEYIRLNGERMKETWFAQELKENKFKYFIITENDKFITDFSIFEQDDNEINLNIVLRADEVLKTIIEYCTGKYDTIKLRTVPFYKMDIEGTCNVIKKKLYQKKQK